MIPDSWRPLIARVAGVVVATLATWLAAKFNFVLSDEDKVKLTEGTVVLIVGLWGLIYSLVHRGVSTKTNPSDAATKKLAHKGKVQQHT